MKQTNEHTAPFDPKMIFVVFVAFTIGYTTLTSLWKWAVPHTPLGAVAALLGTWVILFLIALGARQVIRSRSTDHSVRSD